MRQDVYEIISEDKDALNYLHVHPSWYRHLMRNPSLVSELKTLSKVFYRKSIPDRVNQISQGMQIASMMVAMLGSK